MTTSVTILNHGPDRVSVVPVDDKGEQIHGERRTVLPNTITTFYVYGNRHVHVSEEIDKLP